RRRWVWDVNVHGSRNVYEAALANGIVRFVDASSINALGTASHGELLDEESSDPYRPENPVIFHTPDEALLAVDDSLRGDYDFLEASRLTYFDAKLAARELGRRYERERGLARVTVYPGTAVGPGDVHYAISQLVDSVWDGTLRVTYPGRTSFMDSGDFARGVLAALDRGRPGRGYILAGRNENNLSYAEFMSLVALAAAGESGKTRRDGRPIVLPAWFAPVASRIIESLAPGVGISYGLAISACLGHAFSSARAIAELGYDPRTPMCESILACRRFSEAGRRPPAD
ncbi:MAG: hypothetical protein E4H20_03790, partial [Spirochaetales bacterium]